jgi:PAS domain S-box-containing protein
MEKDQKKLLEALFQTAVDGMIIINARGIIQLVNPAVITLFGYAEEELIGQNISMLMPANDSKQHDQYINNYVETGHKKIIGIGREVWGLRKCGNIFPFRLAVSEVKLAETSFFAGIIHDVSLQKAAEAEIISLNTKLEARIHERTEKLAQVVNTLLQTNENLANEIIERKNVEEALSISRQEVEKALATERALSELKSRFVSTASHEFRTPLSTILSSISLIDRYAQKSSEYEKQGKHIQRIKLSVNNLTGILNDFLSVSRLEEGKVNANISYFDLTELIAEVVEEMEVYTKPKQTIEYINEGEHIRQVCLDPHFLKNILINLISNAIKYSNDGQLVIIRSKVADNQLFISIEDKGMGIAEDEQKHLFERFFRAQNATNIQGTGLGLNIVQRYVELLHGKISYVSRLNEGTTFTITIPLQAEISE